MIKYVSLNQGRIATSTTAVAPVENVIWVDLVDPSDEEKAEVEKQFGVELFTEQESEEIESSSKYAESEHEIGINLNFLRAEAGNYVNEPVSFIIRGNTLFTQREQAYKTFSETHARLKSIKPEEGKDVFLSLLETRIDFDADLIENITEQITRISKSLVKEKNLDRDLLLKIAALQESTIAIRENIVEKQRLLSAILKSRYFPKEDYHTLVIMIKDVGSLLDHSSFNFERLEFLQNTFLGLLDMDQNRIIKIFTVVTVVFMPPTLIASMYGMNFRSMPELDKPWGYPMAIVFMVLSSVITLMFFKRKNWL